MILFRMPSSGTKVQWPIARSSHLDARSIKSNLETNGFQASSVSVANLTSDVGLVDLNANEVDEIGSQQASRVSHAKKKTLEEIKSLVRTDESSAVSFVIVGKDLRHMIKFNLNRPRRRREKHSHGSVAI